MVGVRARSFKGELIVRSDLVVGTDGRHSTVRQKAGLKIIDQGAPMDVLWMRISREKNDPEQSLGRIDRGRILVTINRDEYWQCAFVIPKGTAEQIKARGIENFREELGRLLPHLRGRLHELTSWDDISLLTVKVDRLETWYKPGLICIGDALMPCLRSVELASISRCKMQLQRPTFLPLHLRLVRHLSQCLSECSAGASFRHGLHSGCKFSRKIGLSAECWQQTNRLVFRPF